MSLGQPALLPEPGCSDVMVNNECPRAKLDVESGGCTCIDGCAEGFVCVDPEAEWIEDMKATVLPNGREHTADVLRDLLA